MKKIAWLSFVVFIPFLIRAQAETDGHKCFAFERYQKKITSGLNEFNTRIFTTSNSAIVLPEYIVCKNPEFVELFKQGVIEAKMFYDLDIKPNLNNSSCKNNLIFAKKAYGISIEDIELLSSLENKSILVFKITIIDPDRFNKYYTFDVEVINKLQYPLDRFDLFCKGAHVSCIKLVNIEEPY